MLNFTNMYFHPDEILEDKWTIFFLGEESYENEINSIIDKARSLGYRNLAKPNYFPPLNVVKTFNKPCSLNNSISKAIEQYMGNIRTINNKRFAFLLDECDFSPNEIIDWSCTYDIILMRLNTIIDFPQPCSKANCVNICRDCKEVVFLEYNCVYRLISSLIYGPKQNIYKLPVHLVKSLKNSYINEATTITLRILNENDINYSVIKHQIEAYTCEDVSRERDIPINQILKCMVGKNYSGHIYVMMLPGDRKLKMKKMRRLLGGTNLDLISIDELTIDFGLTIGAITPIHFWNMVREERASFYIDETLLNEEIIDISSGFLNAGIQLKLKDLVMLLKPIICNIVADI